MRRMKDPFPPTPERFHLRVEETLQSLEERDVKRHRIHKKTALLAAVIAAALLLTAALAVVTGHSGLKERLNAESATEVAELVEEPHLNAPADDGTDFSFSIDEIIWEDADLYISYSLSVPEDGGYLVAMYTPTLNGEKLIYDAKGFSAPVFIDHGDANPAVMALGGPLQRSCNALWTFAVDPRLKQRADNRLQFRAVLLKTDLAIEARGSWDDMLNPPASIAFTADWRREIEGDPDAGYAAMMNAVAAVIREKRAVTCEDLIDTGHAAYVTEREITMGLDGTQLAETLFNDVIEHDFDRFGVHIHIDSFRMTHLGASIEYTCTVPGAEDADARRRLNAFIGDRRWRFGTPEGKSLGYSLGGNGGGGWRSPEDGVPAWRESWRDSAILPLSGIDEIIFAPCEYVDDEDGNHPVYDLENAIALRPVYDADIAAAEARATPESTIEGDAEEVLICR